MGKKASDRFINPADAARKKDRKKELKKNKIQRESARLDALKSHDPKQLLDDIEKIDQVTYDPMKTQANEQLLEEKRRKLQGTYNRVMEMYSKENPDYHKQVKQVEYEHRQRRIKMQSYHEQVKKAENVDINTIALPELTSYQVAASYILPPANIPLPMAPTHSRQKKPSRFDNCQTGSTFVSSQKFKPPGPPPGSPLCLSDFEDEEEENAERKCSCVNVPGEDDEPEHLPMSSVQMPSYVPPHMIIKAPVGAMPPPTFPPGVVMQRPPMIGPSVTMGFKVPAPPPGPPPYKLPNGSHLASFTGAPTYAQHNLKSTTNNSGPVTIVAEPVVRNLLSEVTRFTPTTLRVKRDARGQIIKPKNFGIVPSTTITTTPETPKDDAYDAFMKEMRNLI